MALSLIVDDTSLVLLIGIILLLSVSIWISRGYQPLIHPLILSRQADVSQVRHKGQSAIYRNANAPAGFELAARPRRGVNDVSDIVSLGVGTEGWSLTTPRSIYGKSVSNGEILREASSLANGLASIVGAKSLSELAIAISVEADSLESLKMTLVGSLQASVKDRFAPMVVAPAHITRGQPPSNLPASSSARAISAIFTTAVSFKKVSQLSLIDNASVFILPDKAQAEEVRKDTKNKVVTFTEVLSLGQSSSAISSDGKGTVEEVANSVHSLFWTGTSGWIEVTNGSLTSGLTAQLSFYPADAIPSTSDHIFVEQASFLESPSLRLSAAYTPTGLVLPLLALYTGSSIWTGTITSSLSDANPAPSVAFTKARPTLIYASPTGISSLGAALATVSKRNPLCRFAAHSKLSALRHGSLNPHSLSDSLVFKKTREQVGCDRTRAVLIIAEGPVITQSLLDVLRIQLSCPVMHSYLPSASLKVYGSEISAGVQRQSSSSPHKVATLTAPISTTHSLDLQAFSAHEHDGAQVPAHVGPPSVALEVKLVESELAKRNQLSVSGVDPEKDAGRAQDPMGEIFVRGPCLTGPLSASNWCATGDLGTFRSNGTLVVLRDSQKSSTVDVPTFSANYPSTQRREVIGSGTRVARTAITLIMFMCFLTCLSGASANQIGTAQRLSKRASDDINRTTTDTAIMSMLASQRASWEQGVAQTALLELNAGEWSVFGGSNAGPPYRPQHLRTDSSLPLSIQSMAYHAVKTQDRLGKLCARVSGDESATGGSALDPAACGDAVLLAAFSNGQISDTQAADSGYWITGARRMLDYLLLDAPKGPTGAISHRATGVAYWSGESAFLRSMI